MGEEIFSYSSGGFFLPLPFDYLGRQHSSCYSKISKLYIVISSNLTYKFHTKSKFFKIILRIV